MSSQGGAGRREVAWRVFAAEYNDSSLEHSDSDEERAPNYVVTPTGARINRLFVVGVLTEIEQVGDEVLRARIVDPTGGFVVYAGQYQPDALAFLERASPPMFVAVTGKARTFQPDDSDLVYTSIRPESINTVDAETRDRWSVQTAEQTLARVRTFAQALDSGERGDALQQALEANGVDDGLATGVPLALDHYHTTTPYLAGLQDVALDAARVVADEKDEVRALDAEPDEPGEAVIDLGASLDVSGLEPETSAEAPVSDSESDSEIDSGTKSTDTEPSVTVTSDSGTVSDSETQDASTADSETEAGPDSGPETTTPPAEAREPELGGEPTDSEPTSFEPSSSETAESEPEPEPDALESEPEPESFDTDGEIDTDESESESDDGLGDFDSGASESADSSDSPDESSDSDELDDFDEQPMGEDVSGEMYEFEEGERERIEEEFGTDFSTGSEIDSPGEADIETPTPDAESESESDTEIDTAAEPAEATGPDAGAGQPAQTEATEPEAGPDEIEESEPEGASEADSEAESDASDSAGETDSSKEVPGNLENTVMEQMKELNEGDGVEREHLLAAVVNAYDVTPAEVEDALKDALMAGRCYESGDDTLKPI
ncbi:hypothetical protein [Haladaptatus cibarius]|uniref:hypothetical protein n=1 Tax=Haladaptatus cibarius TaxID=453847 RepID=UPI000679D586|nr:hypothetical protein [Haladaptatus cibarius]